MGNDVARLLGIAFTSGGIPETFAENRYFKAAISKLQQTLVGHCLFRLPDRKQFAIVRRMEAAAVDRQNRAWANRVGCGTVAADGRKMQEGRSKESMLNVALVSEGTEIFVRSEDMAGVIKDAAAAQEFTEAIFTDNPDRQHFHAPPSVSSDWVAAVVMDQPSVNVAAMKNMAEKFPTTAICK